MNRFLIYIFMITPLIVISCYPDESIEIPQQQDAESDDELEEYINTNYVEKYGVAVRFKFVDYYVSPDKRVTPPRREVVKPMLDFLQSFWIDPYLQVPNGTNFFLNHVPAEVIFIGSPIFNDDGTVTLGTADAGARITLTEVNDIDITNKDWIFRQLGTIYHEFAHIIHQRYNLPSNWQVISPEGYTSPGSWYNLTDEEALRRGFVSPYATSSFNEDFAETVAFIMFFPEFEERYLTDEADCNTADCVEKNEGRARLRTKFNTVISHYQAQTGVDLLSLRAVIQEKLN